MIHDRRLILQSLLTVFFFFPWHLGAEMQAPEPQWIWSPQYPGGHAPVDPVFFRKVFEVGEVKAAKLEITCDNHYDAFLNGRKVGSGATWQVLDSFEVAKHLTMGKNILAVKGANESPGAAALVARLTLTQPDGKTVVVVTDSSWKTELNVAEGWLKMELDDSKWLPAHPFGAFGRAAPWSGVTASPKQRFKPLEGFHVEEVASPDKTGTLVAMTFTEKADILVSQEKGPLLLVRDTDGDGQFETVTTFCDKLKFCQGILCLSGKVYAIGGGPNGTGLYRLSDEDADNQAEKIEILVEFTSGMQDHGPHVPVLGPDGFLYVLSGNFADVRRSHEPTSPHHHYYEGDLLQPRYEDTHGHAAGVKAPGGKVFRMDPEARAVELFAAGLRNPYDIAFNRRGDLFTYDADMEWDENLPWYRPTRINHLTAGAEFGWRSGWAKWPDYYIDSLPATIDLGRGSPTGVVCYDHTRFPKKYQDALFACDWSRGRILAVLLQPSGSTYAAQSETFLDGNPLNVTDIEPGPDGHLYFTTGGRNTRGGIYRITWTGDLPAQEQPAGIRVAVRQPQFHSAWGRRQLAIKKQEMGPEWEKQLVVVAEDEMASPDDRARALDLLQVLGPPPTAVLLFKLSKDPCPEVRAKAAFLMGVSRENSSGARLVELLSDPDAAVRRRACESLVRSGHSAPPEKLITLLDDPDRFLAWAALRALQSLPKEQWQPGLLLSETPRIFLLAAVGTLALGPEKPTLETILSRGSHLLKAGLPADDLVGLLRVLQLALIQGLQTGEQLPELRQKLASLYPSQDMRANRELVRLLVYLQDPMLAERLVAQLKGESPMPEKLHAAVYARFLVVGWTFELRIQLLEFLGKARTLPGGHSYAGYIDRAQDDFLRGMPDSDKALLLARGNNEPSLVLSLVRIMPENPPAGPMEPLKEIDRKLTGNESPAGRDLKSEIIKVLGRSSRPEDAAYLREVFRTTPDRRPDVALALAQFALKKEKRPEDWGLLTQSLPVVEGNTARESLRALAAFEKRETPPELLRQVILLGLKLLDQGATDAAKLLEYWTGQQPAQPNDPWDKALAAWQEWFVKTYPDQLEPRLPAEPEGSKWTYQQLLGFLNGPPYANGNAERGAAIFEKARCILCHKFGGRGGEDIGPDLTTVSQRFQKKEILESILFPAQVISSQYAAQIVVTKDELTYSGIVGPSGQDALVVFESSGEKKMIRKADIDRIVPSKVSLMPEGLLNTLNQQEIVDLFHFLSEPPVLLPSDLGQGLMTVEARLNWDTPDGYAALTSGVPKGRVPEGCSPGSVSVFGRMAFPVVVEQGAAKRVIVAAGYLDDDPKSGRSIACSHTFWGNPDEQRREFLSNAVRWAGRKAKPVISMSGGVGNETFYRTRGCTVKELTEDLAGVDVVMVNLHHGYPREAVAKFATGGGGIIFFSTPWALDASMRTQANEFLRRFGLAFSGAGPSEPAYTIPAQPHSPYFSALNAADALLRDFRKEITLSFEDKSLGASSIFVALDAAPDLPALNSQLQVLSDTFGWIDITQAKALTPAKQPIEAMLVRFQSRLLDTLPASQLPTHPSAVDWPGLPADRKPVTRTIEVLGNAPKDSLVNWGGSGVRVGTGLYAPPGAVIKVTIPPDKTNAGLEVQVGVHQDQNWNLDTWTRHPKVIRRDSLKQSATETGCAFGGLLFILVPPDSSLGKFPVTLSGGVEAPCFIQGVTKEKDWNKRIRYSPGAWGYLESGGMTIFVSRKHLRNVRNPNEVIGHWDNAIALADKLMGYLDRRRAEAALCDRQIFAGYGHAGYPVMMAYGDSDCLVNVAVKHGDWGFFHELGHTYQDNFDGNYTIATHGEVDVNLVPGILMTLLHRRLPWDNNTHPTFDATSRLNARTAFLALPSEQQTWDRACGSPTGYDFYYNLAETFGWGLYGQALGRIFRFLQNPAIEPEIAALDANDPNYTRNRFFLVFSQESGCNLAPYFERYGLGRGNFGITQSVKEKVANLPVWTDNRSVSSLSNPGTLTVSEGETVGAELCGFTATDPDPGTIFRYSMDAGSDDGAFTLDKETGKLRAGQLNYERCRSYRLTVKVSDHGVPSTSMTTSFTVNVRDVPEAPEVRSRLFRAKADMPAGTVLGTVEAVANAGRTIRSFKLSGRANTAFEIAFPGNGGVSPSPVPANNLLTATLILRDPGCLPKTGLQTLKLRATDISGKSGSVFLHIACNTDAALTEERWAGNAISGSSVYQGTLPSFQAGSVGDHYVRRVRGLLLPPFTGFYTFWIASDDDSILYLSDGPDAAHKQRIAYVSGSTAPMDWEKFPTQKSAPLRLEAGRLYFIEAEQREGQGEDHLSVFWQGPGFARQIIGATAVVPE